jgi:hypothetical protein
VPTLSFRFHFISTDATADWDSRSVRMNTPMATTRRMKGVNGAPVRGRGENVFSQYEVDKVMEHRSTFSTIGAANAGIVLARGGGQNGGKNGYIGKRDDDEDDDYDPPLLMLPPTSMLLVNDSRGSAVAAQQAQAARAQTAAAQTSSIRSAQTSIRSIAIAPFPGAKGTAAPRGFPWANHVSW